MKKSEIVREAASHVRSVAAEGRVCYCTPSREMRLGLQKVAFNENMPDAVDELAEAVAVQLREITHRTARRESLREFDTEDTDAAYSLTNSIVNDAFARAAATYEKAEVGEWLDAEKAWIESLEKATPVRHERAADLDPARQRLGAAKVVKKEGVRGK